MIPSIAVELSAVLDALPDGVVVHHPERGIVYANDAFRAFLALPEGGEILGRSALELVHADDQELVRDRMRVVLGGASGTAASAVRFLTNNGSIVHGECRGIGHRFGDDNLILVIVRDLTDRRRAASALAQSDALFRTLIEDLRIGVLLQGPAAEVLVSNRAALDLLGLNEAQLLGMTSFDRDWNVIREDGSTFPGPDHPVPTAIRTGRAVRDVVMGVYRPRRRDRVWLLVNAEPQFAADGSVTQVVCTFSDITEQRRQQAQAAAGDRLASMGRLAASVAHEINNPLAYVVGHLEALERSRLEGALHEKVEAALEGARRVRAIVEDMRSLSRGDDERRGPVDLARVVASACNIAEPHARHRARLVRDIRAAPPVDGNESRLGQLVLNLIMNAVEALDDGRAEESEIRVKLYTGKDGRSVLEVKDTGPGILPSVIDRIFDPFFTTKEIGVGTGLGLAICHGVVTAMRGEIQVESTLGAGCTFRVSLPAGARVEPDVEPAPASRPPRSRILIVDDDPRVAQLLADMLCEQHDVEVEGSATTALARLTAGERYDVIFCDLMMPNMTGMEFQQGLEARVPELAERTIFVTGGAFTPRARAFVSGLADRALAKPFRLVELERAIARIRARSSTCPPTPR